MKNAICTTSLIAGMTICAVGQPPAHSAYSLVEIGQHHRSWSRITLQTNLQGQIQLHTNSFTELGTGLNHWDGRQWIEANPELVREQRGIIGRGAGHSAIFAKNLSSRNAIQIQMPDGQWFKSHILGLAYYDSLLGTNVLIAEPQNTAPEIVSTNQVVYPSAFTDFRADVRYSYTRAGVQQDVVLGEKPPSPELWGLDPDNTDLIVISEIDEAPVPQVREKLNPSGRNSVRDQTLDFGSMHMIPGRALSLANTHKRRTVSVTKQYDVIQGRRVILERVPFDQIRGELLMLPPAGTSVTNSIGRGATNASIDKVTRFFARGSLPDSGHLLAMNPPAQKSARIKDKSGFVIDWDYIENAPDQTFACGTTWLVQYEYHLPSATFEPGTVIKYNYGASMWIDGPLSWSSVSGCGDTALLTSVNDDAHGDIIDGWSNGGFPSWGDYGPALVVQPADYTTAQNDITVLYGVPGIVANVPEVTITVPDPIATKGSSDTATFRLARSGGDWGQRLTVNLAITGTAVSGDYTLTAPFTFDIDQGTKDLTLTPQSTAWAVHSKSVILTILPNAAYTIGSPVAAVAFILDTAVAPAAPTAAAPNLVSWWRGETDASDSLGANNGSLLNVTCDPAYVGKGFNFNGSLNSRLVVNSAASLNFGNNADYSLEAWIQPIQANTTYGVQSIIDKRYTPNDSTATGYTLHLVNGQLGCQIAVAGGPANFGPAGPDLRDGQFHHVALTVDRDSISGGNLYVDGKLILNFDPSDQQGDLSNSDYFRIGNHANISLNANFTGLIDEVALYNRALTPDEVRSIYDAGSSGKAIPPAITTQPASQTITVGATAAFTVVATGTAPLLYQWQLNGVDVAGATASSFSIVNAQAINAGHYSVNVANAVGRVTSSIAILTLTPDPHSTDLRLWLKGDAGISPGAGPVQTWADQSDFHYDANQMSGGSQPTWVSGQLNGLPVVRFNGSSHFLNIQSAVLNSSAPLSAAEVFVVLKSTAPGKLWQFGHGGSTSIAYPNSNGDIVEDFASFSLLYPIGTPAQPLNQYHIYNVSGQNGNWMAAINGVLLSSANGNSFGTSSQLLLGQAFGTYFSGDIAELLIYGRSLTVAERDSINAYLNSKYALIGSVATPTNLKAASVSAHQISLIWNEVSANSSITFRIERKTVGSDWSLVASVRDRTSYLDTGLSAGTTYYYRVKAVNTGTESGYSNEAGATTAASGTDMPTTGLSLWLAADAGISATPGGTVYLWPDQSGSPNPDNAIQSTFSVRPTWVDNQVNGRPVIRFDGLSQYFTFSLPGGIGGSSGSEAFVVLKANGPGALWHLGGSTSGAQAYPDTDGNIADDFGSSGSSVHNLGAPAQPLNQFHVYNIAGRQGGTWLAAVNGVLLTSANGNSYNTWSSPVLGRSAGFFSGDIAEVLIYNRMLTSDERDSVNAYLETKYAVVSVAPSQPVSLAANPISAGQVGLSWRSALGNVSTLFLIERKIGSGGPYAQVAKVRDASSFIDTGLSANTTYYYRVRAANPAGASAYSPESSATTALALPGISDIPMSSLLTWLKADGGLVGAGGTAPVSTWLDQSGNFNHAAQSFAVTRASWVDNQVNGRAVVRFDGSSQYFNLPANLLGGGLVGAEAFVALKAVQAVPDYPHFLWHLGGSSSSGSYSDTDGDILDDFASSQLNRVGKPAQPLDQFHLYNVAGQSASWMAAINGVVQFSTTLNTYISWPGPTLGGPNTFFAGDIGEIMIFNRVLTSAERDSVNKYLGLKYVLSTSAPAAPSHVAAQQVSSTQIGLIWSAPLGNISTVFHIERKTGANQYAEVATVRDGTSFLDTGLAPGTSYNYQVKAVSIVGESAYSASATASTAPSGSPDMPLGNLKLWLKADTGLVGANGAPVSFWADQSGNHNDATQPNPDVRPVIIPSTLFWQPVVRFDGQSQYMQFAQPFLTGLSGAEAFVVVKASSTTPSTAKRLWRIGGSGSGSLAYPNQSGNIVDDFASSSTHTFTPPGSSPINQFRLYNVSGQDGGNWLASINGASPTTQVGNSYGAWANPTISSSLAGSAFAGDIAEILIYNQVLSAAQRTVVQNYLMNKYHLEDSDGDGIIDGWELQYFGNLATANRTCDYGQGPVPCDYDHDGILDIDECRLGLDPTHWNGVQNIHTENNVIHAGDTDHSLRVSFDAPKPENVTIKFYKFAYQYDSATKNFATYNTTFLNQISANVPAGHQTLSWDGNLPNGQFHTAEIVVYDVVTSDGSHSETWSPMTSYRPAHAKGTSATFAYGAQFTNTPGKLTVSWTQPGPIIVNNQYHQSLLADTVIASSVPTSLDFKGWFGISDSGLYVSEVSGTYQPEAVNSRAAPVGAAAMMDFNVKVDNFSVEAFRVTAAQGEVVHAVFHLSKPAYVTLRILDPSGGVFHPVYYRDNAGNYTLVDNLRFETGDQDLEFYPVNQDTSPFRLFGDKSSTDRYSAQYNGYFRVYFNVTDVNSGKSQFCWASLKIK